MADNFIVHEEYVEAEVYKTTESNGKPLYLVKIKLLEIGVFIIGIRVSESPNRPEDGLWVQMPAMRVGKWINIIECTSDSPFLEIVKRKAIEAVESCSGGKDSSPTIKDQVVPDDGSPISLDHIPF
jgi:hypothetical protein